MSERAVAWTILINCGLGVWFPRAGFMILAADAAIFLLFHVRPFTP